MQFFGLSLCLKFLTSCGCTPTTFADNPSGRTRLFAGTLSDLSKKTRSSKNNGSLSPGRGKSFGRSHKKISSNKKRLLSRSQVLYSTPPEDVH
uniref:Secreted protein n=1 Tax=Aegilops tauschii subsp. strangulata TaxID=200361 RepID=A0A453NXN9_AEGTS